MTPPVDVHPRNPQLKEAGDELYDYVREWLARHKVTSNEYLYVLSSMLHHQTFGQMAAEWSPVTVPGAPKA